MGTYCYGVDVGGTTVKIGRFDKQGNAFERWKIITRTEENGRHILPDIIEAIQENMKSYGLDKEEIIGVGIGVPAPVSEDGVVNGTANLGWGYVDVKKVLENALGVPVKVGNDANVAALGEMWKGGGEGYQNGVMVTLGTGVGGGIILDGQILSGSNGAAGEIGHLHVQDDEEECCGCGNKGCLEQYASATGIVRIGKRVLAAVDKDTPLRDGELSAKSIFDQVKAGDEVAMEIAEQFGSYLGKALANLAATLNPQVFIIGGGVSRAGEVLLDYIKKYYLPAAFFACKDVKFVLATLGNDAGMYGSAKMVL